MKNFLLWEIKVQDEVFALLEKASLYLPTYQNGMSNHLPMVLIALSRIGAKVSDIKKFYAQYIDKLILIPDNGDNIAAITHDNWRIYLGSNEYYKAYSSYFSEECQQLGHTVFLNQYIGLLANGIGSGAFHALIRLGYALDLYNDNETLGMSEIVASISYWASHYLNIGNISDVIRYSGPEQAFNHLYEQCKESVIKASHDGLIYQRMQSAAAQYPQLAELVTRFVMTSNTLTELNALALKSHIQCNTFETLHLITASHALQLVMQQLSEGEKEIVANAFAYHFASVYLAIGLPQLAELNSDEYQQYEQLDWQPLYQQAIESGNDHTIKLLYSCNQHYQRESQPIYKFIAQRHLS